MRRKITLKESELTRLIHNSVRKLLNEGRISGPEYDKWEQLKEALGCEQLLDELLKWVDDNVLNDFIERTMQVYDLDLDYDHDID